MNIRTIKYWGLALYLLVAVSARAVLLMPAYQVAPTNVYYPGATPWSNLGNYATTNAQGVFNWIDYNWMRIDTNSWNNIAPLSPSVQATFDWIDDFLAGVVVTADLNDYYLDYNPSNYLSHIHYSTNMDPGVVATTNIADGAITARKMALNSVHSTNIIDGTVSNVDMSVNSVAGSNVIDGTIEIEDVGAGYMKMPRIAGFHTVGGDAICATCGSAPVGVISPTYVSQSTLFGLYAYLVMTNVGTVSSDPLSLMYLSALVSSNNVTWHTVDISAATVSYTTNVLGVAINSSSPAQVHWFVPASNYYKVEATAGSSLQAHQRWTCSWQRTYSMPTGP